MQNSAAMVKHAAKYCHGDHNPARTNYVNKYGTSRNKILMNDTRIAEKTHLQNEIRRENIAMQGFREYMIEICLNEELYRQY